MTKGELLEEIKQMETYLKNITKMIERGELKELTALDAYKDIEFYINHTFLGEL